MAELGKPATPHDNICMTIVKMLTGLSKEERRRVIQFLATFFEVTI